MDVPVSQGRDAVVKMATRRVVPLRVLRSRPIVTGTLHAFETQVVTTGWVNPLPRSCLEAGQGRLQGSEALQECSDSLPTSSVAILKSRRATRWPKAVQYLLARISSGNDHSTLHQ